MGYIYKVTNKINNKIYIGKTINTVDYRWHQHVREAKNKPNTNILLHNAINKYGESNFIIEILEECNNNELLKKETEYILKYNSFYKNNIGYNMTYGGDGTTLYDDNDFLYYWEQGLNIKEIAQEMNCNPVTVGIHLHNYIDNDTIKARGYKNLKKSIEQYNVNGEFITIWSSATEAANFLKVDSTHITGCCRYKQVSAYGFLWKYVSDTTPITTLVDNYISSSNCKDVYEVTKKGEIIKWYSSPKDAEIDLNIARGKVSYICNFPLGKYSAKNHYFIWANKRKRELLGFNI